MMDAKIYPNYLSDPQTRLIKVNLNDPSLGFRWPTLQEIKSEFLQEDIE